MKDRRATRRKDGAGNFTRVRKERSREGKKKKFWGVTKKGGGGEGENKKFVIQKRVVTAHNIIKPKRKPGMDSWGKLRQTEKKERGFGAAYEVWR